MGRFLIERPIFISAIGIILVLEDLTASEMVIVSVARMTRGHLMSPVG